MLASLLLLSLTGAEVTLTPPPAPEPNTPELVASPPPPEDPDAHGRGWLKHAFALATLGTSMSGAGGVVMGLVIQSGARCTASTRCSDEGTGAIGLIMGSVFLAVGLSMVAFAIPLFVNGFRERLGQ